MDDLELKQQIASLLASTNKTLPKATDYGDNLDQGTIKQISKYDYFTRPVIEKATEARDVLKHFIPGISDVSDAVDTQQSANDFLMDMYKGNYSDAKSSGIDTALNGIGLLPFIPALGTLAGKAAKNADLLKLDRAMKLLDEGNDAKKIYKETGWFNTPWDDQWKFEIPDKNPDLQILDKVQPDEYGIKEINLDSVLNNKELVDNYPELKNVKISDERMEDLQGAFFSSRDNHIALGEQAFNTPSSVLHETQHKIQELEGFGRGGNPDQFIPTQNKMLPTLQEELKNIEQAEFLAKNKDNTQAVNDYQELIGSELSQYPYSLAQQYSLKDLGKYKRAVLAKLKYERMPIFNKYQRLPGEAEARIIQKRMDYTPEQRQSIFPLDDLDVPLSDIMDIQKLIGK